jgi:hypothetical protein
MASPTPVADAGFCPVTSRSLTTTLGCQIGAA